MITESKQILPKNGKGSENLNHIVYFGEILPGKLTVDMWLTYLKEVPSTLKYDYISYARHDTRILKDDSIYFYQNEYPIIQYSSEFDNGLNYFVKSVSASIFENGSIHFYDNKISEELLSRHAIHSRISSSSFIPYFTNYNNCNYAVTDIDLQQLILKNCNIFLTHTGILLFYTDKYIYATLDMKKSFRISHKFTKEEICYEAIEATGKDNILLINVKAISDDGTIFTNTYNLKLKVDLANINMPITYSYAK